MEKQAQCKNLLLKLGYRQILHYYSSQRGEDYAANILGLDESVYDYYDPLLLIAKASVSDHSEIKDFLEEIKSINFNNHAIRLSIAHLVQRTNPIDQDTVGAIYAFCAEQGNAKALEYLSNKNRDIHGRGASYRSNLEYCKSAASQGNPISLFDLGYIYERTNREIEHNLQSAIECYRLPKAEQHPLSLIQLAGLYREGKGVEKDLGKSAELYFEAIKKGSIDAVHIFVSLYDTFEISAVETLEVIFVVIEKFIKKEKNDYERLQRDFSDIRTLIEKLPRELKEEFKIEERTAHLQPISFELPSGSGFSTFANNHISTPEERERQQNLYIEWEKAVVPEFQSIVAAQKERILTEESLKFSPFLKVGLVLISDELKSFLGQEEDYADLLEKYSHLPVDAFMNLPFSQEADKETNEEQKKIIVLQKKLRLFFYGSEEEYIGYRSIPVDKNFLLPLLYSIKTQTDQTALAEVFQGCFQSQEINDLWQVINKSSIVKPDKLTVIRDVVIESVATISNKLEVELEELKHKRQRSPSPDPDAKRAKKLDLTADEKFLFGAK
ncbi:MAG: tetratricopeptide repeat protein [Pseudomonadota bacterium]